LKKRVLIVDDSAFMRKLISDFLASSDQLVVVGTARNGQDALAKIKSLKPDVITLDVEMPEMNGIEALKLIMADCPLPVVMLSSTTEMGAENTLTAMELGAVDFIPKPSGTISLDLHKIKDQIIEKVVAASGVQVSRLASRQTKQTLVESPLNRKPKESHFNQLHTSKVWSKSKEKIICIGSSTGGPRALQHVLTKLPASIKAPILVVQHMPPGFTKSLAVRLNALSAIEVKEAENGEILKRGTAYIAPGGFHLKIKNERNNLVVQLDQEEAPRKGHRPSVDVLFESISILKDFDKIAVIMTGMGADGSKGLVKLKKDGNTQAIAESKDSCIVFGMPKAAIATNLIDDVENVENIAHSIMKFMV
jgi:two-component system, chemotaxis family, protein-glutamate methylesterase/glutaminase